MGVNERVTAVIVHFRTPDLLLAAVGSLRARYPGLPLLVVDNGSTIESASAIEKLRSAAPDHVRSILNDDNLHHGPAMDQALRAAVSPYVLILDSDCEVLEGGFIEAMTLLLDGDPTRYVAGKKIFMNRRGFDVSEGTPGSVPYIRPVCMLLRRDLYLTLPPFQRHGAPCLDNMTEAAVRGLGLVDFPVERYVSHAGRGTASRHGYRLGFSGKLNHLLHKLGL